MMKSKKENIFNSFKHGVVNKVFYCELCYIILNDLNAIPKLELHTIIEKLNYVDFEIRNKN